MRLIDLDDSRHCYVGNDGEYERWNIDPETSTIDAVEIVRCHDCKYSEEATGVAKDIFGCDKLKMITKADWFCAEGKRGEDGKH